LCMSQPRRLQFELSPLDKTKVTLQQYILIILKDTMNCPRGLSSNTVGVTNFHFFISSRPTLGTTHPPIQWVTGGSFPGGKVAGA
jgi:hypothetical protein